jgi:hypothetical protein
MFIALLTIFVASSGGAAYECLYMSLLRSLRCLDDRVL